MKIIVCLDKSSGMLFNNRRQSRDAILIDDVINYCGENKIMCNRYSAELFNGKTSVCVSETFLTDAGDNDFCFIENVIPETSTITELVIYWWNRAYPSDLKFNIEPKQNGFKKKSKIDFKGSSHEKITREVWEKK